MMVWSGCSDVSRSRFVDFQETLEDFEELQAIFEDPEEFIKADKKDELPLFMPAEYPQVRVRRCVPNVLRIHFLVIDIDEGDGDDFDALFDVLDRYSHIAYTSFSHDPNGQWKFRVIVKLSRPVDVTEWSSFFPRALDVFRVVKIADKKCADAAHMFYVPGGDKSKYLCTTAKGLALDVDEVLARPLPADWKPPKDQRDTGVETLAEEDRGEVSEGLKDYWEGQLQILVNDIYKRPYPGSFYDLKSHRVFGLARGCPHILDPERLRTMIKVACDGRYRQAGALGKPECEALRQKTHEQIDTAIEQGVSRPWYPPKVNEVPVRPFTELGLAERFVDQFAEDIRYEPTWDAWLTWNGVHWDQKAGVILVQENMTKTVRRIPEEAAPHYVEYWQARELYQAVLKDPNTSEELKAKAEFDYEERKKLIEGIRSFATKSETASKIAAATKLARSKPSVLSDYQRFNRDPWLLNFKNGTVNLRTGEFRSHKREDYITRVAPYDYDEDAKCPRFDQFLADCMLDNSRMVDFLWRAMGYTAIGVTDEQKLFLLHGDGANGKSTFLNVMLDLFGQHGTGYAFAANSSHLLTNKGSEQHSTWRMDGAGVRLLAANEVDEGKGFAESLIKELTGSDIITGRRMRQDNWSYRPEFALWLAANVLPHVRGTDEGIWRRLVVIEWLANFQAIADRALPRKLLAEASGIWARLVREARAWAQHGLTLPREVVAASTRYRQEQDPLKDFIDRWCTAEKEGLIERSLLWAAYEEHCTDTRSKTFHERKRFYAALEKQFTIKTIKGVRFFSGVRLKTPQERAAAAPRLLLARAQKDPSSNKPN